MYSSVEVIARRVMRAALIGRGCVLALALQACASQPGRFVWIDQLTDAQVTMPTDSYVVGVGDMLSVQVFSHPEMSGRTRVRADGRVSIALLGDVAAAGRSPVDLAREIEKELGARDLAVAARVTVLLDEAAPIRVSVIGEVNRPGLYILEPGAGLAEALASGGGFTDFAHRDRLYVVRRSPELIRIRFTYDAVTRAEGRAAQFRLRAGDTIVVE